MEAAVTSSDEHPWWGDLVDDLPDYYGNDSFYEDNSYEDADVCDLTKSMDFEAVFIPVLYSVVFVVGILGNGLLIAVLMKNRKTWSVTDTFILHLALADVLLLLLLPLWAAQSASLAGWPFGTPLCKITGAMFTVSLYCGIFLLACISVDRYLFIVHSTKMYTRRKPWVVQASCLVVWLVSLILSIPDWYFLEAVEDVRRSRTECVHNYFKINPEYFYILRMAARWLYHTLGFLLPSFVLVFCYSCILLQLGCGTKGLRKQRAFKVIVAVVSVFFLCWTPLNITLIVDTIHQNNDSGTACGTRTSLQIARLVTESLGYLHCSLNPILYAFVGLKFQHQLLNILRSMGCKLKTSLKSESSFWSQSADASNSIEI
ncbi:C-X-C chemokine receptor type 3-like [Poecilia reticulata]|uniref:C-X-C chemokine receptor type 3 n=1 Tax=Poecilia reticulata TaxID=8081 RepID=A0A3P9PGX2_POERE|nr:PREDICTED: C-X-C chemokine receptor type 3-like [Poecilia reticulata]XP_008429509.1 PREDICTED: C-X-C chemokine receptor type 3-like [Poecilia reticulata]